VLRAPIKYCHISFACLVTLVFLCMQGIQAQNSMVGDGFGGRLWYKPYNYTVGSYSAYTVCGDSNQLYGWGANHHYELGDGSKVNTNSPVKALGMTNVRYYSTGYNMGAIKYDSTGWVWGAPVSNFPRKILDSVKFLDASSQTISFVKYDGTVWSVGRNATGTFGNDSINSGVVNSPRKALNINTAVRVALTRENLAILLSNGDVWVTGSNNQGCLGTGANPNTREKVPVKITRLKKIVDIKGTAVNFAALDSFGNVFTWGSSAAIGVGSSKQDTPILVNTISNIVAISACDDGTNILALDANHIAYGWGPNYAGNLGIGNSASQYYLPVQIATDVADIMSGETFTYIVKIDGSLWAAGRSNGGSIWMNLKDTIRKNFTKIDPTIAPLNLCELPPFAGNYYRVKTIPCVYDSIVFQAAENDSFTNFHWDFGDGSSQEYGMEFKHKFQNTGEYSVKLFSVRKSTGLKDTVTRVITINDASYANLFNGDTLICDRVAYEKTPLVYDEDAQYFWSDGTVTFKKFINTDGLHTLKVTDRNGCHYADSFKVILHENPKALFKADTYSMCSNSKGLIKFTNLSTSKDSIVRCRWDFTEDTLSTLDSVVYFKFKVADFKPVWLSVWTAYGCKSDTIDVFDILSAPKPLFDLTINDSCQYKNSITLLNKTLKDTIQNPRFKWYFSEGFILSNRNPTAPRIYTDTGKFYIDLIYTNSNKCTDTLRKFVHIYPHPQADFILNSPICSRDSIAFPNTSSSHYNPLKSQWNFGDLQNSNRLSPKHKYPSKGIYSVKLTVKSPQDCADSVVKSLVVYNPPKADFTIDDSVQCLLGNVFKLTSKAKADSGSLVDQFWQYSDLNNEHASTPSNKSFSSAQKFSIKLLVTDMFACTDSIVKWIEVKNGPVVDFNINDPSQCENGQNFNFNYQPINTNDSIVNIEWRILSQSYFNQSTYSSKTFPLGKTSIQLILNTKFGCPGLNNKNVVVNPVPKADFSINQAVQCFDGHQFNFTNNSTVTSGSIKTNAWSFGDLSISSSVNPSGKTYSTFGQYTVKLFLESDSLCADSTSQDIEINPNPIIDIQSVKPVCLGKVTDFSSLSSIAQGLIVDYTWDFGDNTFGKDSSAQHIYSNSGIYTIVLNVKSDKGCIASKTYPSASEVYPLPNAQFNYSLEEGDQNNSLLKFNNQSAPNPLISFWDFAAFGKAIHDTALSIEDTVSVKSSLLVIDINGCSNQISKTIFASGPMLLFIPNAFSPNSDQLNDFFNPNGRLSVKEYHIYIYNRWGELLFESKDHKSAWDGNYKNSMCPQDVYTYWIDLVDVFGKRKTYRGTFTLLR
jgi:gliding motility-associated-like protein